MISKGMLLEVDDGGGNNSNELSTAADVSVHVVERVLGVASDSLAYFRHPSTCVNGESMSQQMVRDILSGKYDAAGCVCAKHAT